MIGRALLLLLGLSSTAFSQTIYEPPRFQYHSRGQSFYYGGNDPWTFERGSFFGLRPLENEPLRVFTDRLPNVNAARWGFTIDDARNDAYNAVPRYFRKGDLASPPPPAEDVERPGGPGTIEIKPYVRPTQPPPRVLTLP